jgi:hypothetical protein
MVGRKLDGHAGRVRLVAAEHAAMQSNAGVIENLALVMHHGASQQVVAHHIDRGMEQSRVRSRHNRSKRLLSANKAPGIDLYECA